MFFGKKMVEIYHDILAETIRPGETVLDGTAGNGYDTEYLCRLTGETGCVHAFDIQEAAIRRTQQRLEDAGLESRARLHLDSHENVDRYIREPIAAFCFNLGYLPEGDPGIITTASTTATALQKALELLRIHGVGCVLCYWGHEGGKNELEMTDALLKGLKPKQFEVFRLENHNRANHPPVLYVIKRKKI